MRPEITIDFYNHQYEIHFEGKVIYVDFTKSSQLEIIINEMIIEMRNNKLEQLGIK
jgi:hypothetical protein